MKLICRPSASGTVATAALSLSLLAGTMTTNLAIASTASGIPPTISLAKNAINVGQSTTMSCHGTPGDTVTLYYETAPTTAFKVQTTHALDPYDNWVAGVSPRLNTKYYAATAAGSSAAVQVSVRPALALRGTASGRTVAFKGQVVPGHSLTLRLYSVKLGRLTLIATRPTSTSGAWAYTRTFGTTGAVQFLSQSVSDATNLAGQSNRLSLTLR